MNDLRNKFTREELRLINQRATTLNGSAWALCQATVMAEALRLKLAGQQISSDVLVGIDVDFTCMLADKPF